MKRKNIVLCFDGTGGEHFHRTNPLLIASLTKKIQNQVVWYDPGVATGGFEYNQDFQQRLEDFVSGVGLQKNIEDGYQFLMETYNVGDRIFMFGHSRGSYTAASLCGMIDKVGLLRRKLTNLVPYATQLYNTDREATSFGSTLTNEVKAQQFAKEFCRHPTIEFLGLFDTVGALSGDAAKRQHDVRLIDNTAAQINYCYHAVAIDERRADFAPTLITEDRKHNTRLNVYFAGAHGDVGGGYAEMGPKDREASNTALYWMLLRAAGLPGLKLRKNWQAQFEDEDGEHYYSHTGKIHNSFLGWQSRGEQVRQIPEGSYVHASVKNRLDAGGYTPTNLPQDINWLLV